MKPGLRRAAWLSVCLAALTLYLFANGPGTLLVLAAAALPPLLTACALLLPRRTPSADLTLSSALRRGGTAECVLTVSNPSRCPLPGLRCTLELCNLMTGESFRQSIPCPVGGKRETSIRFSVTPAHCGRLRARVTDVRLFDPFGLFSRPIPCRAERDSDIPPQTSAAAAVLADTADFLSDSQQYSAQRPGYDPSETFRIREYVPGDPIRQIHWKLSGKTDHLLVRDLGLPIVNRMLLLLDPSPLPSTAALPDDMDLMLDLLASVSQALLAEGVCHTLGWQDAGAYCRRDITDPADLDSALTQILQTPLASGAPSAAELCASDLSQGAYAHAAVIAPAPPPDAVLLCRGGRVTVLLCGEPAEGPAGVEVTPIDPAVLRRGELSLIL